MDVEKAEDKMVRHLRQKPVSHSIIMTGGALS